MAQSAKLATNLQSVVTEPALKPQILVVSPNPATNLVAVSLNAEGDYLMQIMISNLQGKLVLQDDLSTISALQLRTIDVARLPRGNYVLTVVTANGSTYSKQLILE
jgi:Secretion system C-terminal sorting domain